MGLEMADGHKTHWRLGYLVGLLVAIGAFLGGEPAAAEVQATAWLGVSIRDGSGHGVLITEVIDGTPAANSGLVAGDLVVALGGQPVRLSGQFIAIVRAHRVDDELEVVFLRNANIHKTSARLIAFEVDPDAVIARRLVDRPAPEIFLERLPERTPTTLSALRGRPVVLVFFATSCSSCPTLFSTIASAIAPAQGKRQATQLIAVASDPPAALTAYLSRVTMPPEFKVFSDAATDPEFASAQRYFIDRVPLLVVLDRAGVVRFASFGPDDPEILDNAAHTLSRLRALGPL